MYETSSSSPFTTEYRDISWKQRTISSPRFRPFELAAVSSRRNDFLLDGAFSPRVTRRVSRRPYFPSQSGKSANVPFTSESCALIFQSRMYEHSPSMYEHSPHLTPPVYLNPRSLSRIGGVGARRPPPTGTTFSPLRNT